MTAAFVDSLGESVDQLRAMELSGGEKIDNSLSLSNEFLRVSCNWQITNNKDFHSAFTVAASSQAPEKVNFEDVVSLDTCISVQPIQSNSEPCMLDIKLINRQRISHIAVVSEACVLEFFKQFGEYETTAFAEFVDEFENNSVFFAETAIVPPATEASIKFTKTMSRNSVMWIYGIRLYLTEPSNEPESYPADMFNPEIITNFLTKLNLNSKKNKATNDIRSCYKNILNLARNQSTEEGNGKEAQGASENAISNMGTKAYIDYKFHDMETRMMKRIDEMEQRTNQKLDIISKQLGAHFIVK